MASILKSARRSNKPLPKPGQQNPSDETSGPIMTVERNPMKGRKGNRSYKPGKVGKKKAAPKKKKPAKKKTAPKKKTGLKATDAQVVKYLSSATAAQRKTKKYKQYCGLAAGRDLWKRVKKNDGTAPTPVKEAAPAKANPKKSKKNPKKTKKNPFGVTQQSYDRSLAMARKVSAPALRKWIKDSEARYQAQGLKKSDYPGKYHAYKEVLKEKTGSSSVAAVPAAPAKKARKFGPKKPGPARMENPYDLNKAETIAYLKKATNKSAGSKYQKLKSFAKKKGWKFAKKATKKPLTKSTKIRKQYKWQELTNPELKRRIANMISRGYVTTPKFKSAMRALKARGLKLDDTMTTKLTEKRKSPKTPRKTAAVGKERKAARYGFIDKMDFVHKDKIQKHLDAIKKDTALSPSQKAALVAARKYGMTGKIKAVNRALGTSFSTEVSKQRIIENPTDLSMVKFGLSVLAGNLIHKGAMGLQDRLLANKPFYRKYGAGVRAVTAVVVNLATYGIGVGLKSPITQAVAFGMATDTVPRVAATVASSLSTTAAKYLGGHQTNLMRDGKEKTELFSGKEDKLSGYLSQAEFDTIYAQQQQLPAPAMQQRPKTLSGYQAVQVKRLSGYVSTN